MKFYLSFYTRIDSHHMHFIDHWQHTCWKAFFKKIKKYRYIFEFHEWKKHLFMKKARTSLAHFKQLSRINRKVYWIRVYGRYLYNFQATYFIAYILCGTSDTSRIEPLHILTKNKFISGHGFHILILNLFSCHICIGKVALMQIF